MVFRYLIETFPEDKISRVADFVVSDSNNLPPPVPVRWCLLIRQNLINNSIGFANSFNAESPDIHIGEFIVSGDSNIPMIGCCASVGVGSDVMGRNVTVQFWGLRVNFCVNPAKIVGPVSEQDNISGSGGCPRVIRVRQKIFDRLRTDCAIAVSVINIVSCYNFSSVSAATGCCAPFG